MKTKYILTKDYEVIEVKAKMYKPKNEKTGTHYFYAHPEDYCGFLVIHKDNVIMEADNLSDMTDKLKCDKALLKKFINAQSEAVKKEYELQIAMLNKLSEDLMEENNDGE